MRSRLYTLLKSVSWRELSPVVSRNRIVFKSRFSSTCSVKHQQIREIFDNEEYWRQVNGADKRNFLPKSLSSGFGNNSKPLRSTGLFKNPYLTSPDGLEQFTDEMLDNAKSIVDTLINDSSEAGRRKYIKNLDTLSDVLCKVIDLCEFIRVSHPDKHFLESAERCYEKMFNYMNLLNTNVELYEKLDALLRSNISKSLSEEEVVVGNLLLADFKKSGIDKDLETRNLFINLSSRIAMVGQYFNNNTFDVKKDRMSVDKKLLESSVSSEIYKEVIDETGRFASTGPRLKFNVASYVSVLLLKNCSNESVRQQIWNSFNSSSPKQIQLLELMLNYRKLLSIKLGCKDFNEYQLHDKMAQNSKNVLVFLQNLEKKLLPHCIEELRLLTELKIKDYELSNKNVDTKHFVNVIENFDMKITKKMPMSDSDVMKFIRPWDRDYLIQKHLVSKRRTTLVSFNSKPIQPITNFFSLGTVLSRLSTFLSQIYGVKFKFDRPLSGEIWHPDVRKLLVVNSEDENDIVGIIYLDLLERAGKSMSPAHFTIVCSRKVTDEMEVKKCVFVNENEQEGQDMSGKYIQCVRSENGIYQLPIITLVCNFSKTTKTINNQARNIALLRLGEVETLLHEIGHSLHSMFGKTSLHNVSGTRCMTDFVELPSILMETFSKDSRVLQFLSDSYEDVAESEKEQQERYKASLIELHQSENGVLKYCDVYSQLKMAYLDQHLHLQTPNPVYVDENTGQQEIITDSNKDLITEENLDQLATSNFNYTEKLYHEAEAKLGILADVDSTWYGKFGHLFTYGATYYTYLFDRAISSKIYEELFMEDPFNTENGIKFRDTVLKWGGSRSPWMCIGECLEDPRLTAGNENSMKVIGKIEDMK